MSEKNEKCCHCSESGKVKERSPEEYKKLMNRLNRIEGQVKGIKKMLSENAYCTDILTQSAAVGAAVDAFNRELLESHISSCFVDGIREGNDEVVGELITIIKRFM